jgi:hypothetical protein
MYRKFGIIVCFPNCILRDLGIESNDELVCDLIYKYMGIDLYECNIEKENRFQTDCFLMKIMSNVKKEGLIEHHLFADIAWKNFPVGKYSKKDWEDYL